MNSYSCMRLRSLLFFPRKRSVSLFLFAISFMLAPSSLLGSLTFLVPSLCGPGVFTGLCLVLYFGRNPLFVLFFEDTSAGVVSHVLCFGKTGSPSLLEFLECSNPLQDTRFVPFFQIGS